MIVLDLEWNQSSYTPNHRSRTRSSRSAHAGWTREGRVVSRFSELICPGSTSGWISTSGR